LLYYPCSLFAMTVTSNNTPIIKGE